MIHLHNPEGSERTGRNKISFLYNPSLAFPYLSKNDSDPSLLPSLLPCCIALTSDATFLASGYSCLFGSSFVLG